MGSGEGRRVGPGGVGGGRAPGVEHRALDAGVGRRGWTPGFGPGAGERVGRPKRRPGQLGGRTVGRAAGRPNGRVKEWKGWQGRTEKDGNGKGPGPSGSRSVKGSFGQPLRSAKGPVKGPVRSVRASARRSSFPRESHPVKSRPARVSACRGFVRSLPRSAKGLFRQGLGPSRVRSVTLPRSAKGRSVKVPARPGLGPPEFLPERVAPRQGPVRPSLGSPEFLPGRVAPPLHVRVPTAPFPLSSPFMSSSSPLPLRRLLPLRRPAPPSCVPVRLSRRGRDSTAGDGIARAKMWNGISGAERRAAAASGAPLPRPPGSRPEPTPGRQTSRERGGERHPGKGKNKEQERVFEQKGPKPAKRRSGRAAKGRPVEQCRCTEMKRSSGKAVPR